MPKKVLGSGLGLGGNSPSKGESLLLWGAFSTSLIGMEYIFFSFDMALHPFRKFIFE